MTITTALPSMARLLLGVLLGVTSQRLHALTLYTMNCSVRACADRVGAIDGQQQVHTAWKE